MANPYDAIVLDLGLPDGDGLSLLGEMRARGSAVPTLVLTARDAVEHRVAGLDAGADDYLIKPFATSEVVARVKALLRRPGGALGTVLSSGNIAFDTVGRDVRIGDAVLALPRRESAILEHLMRRAGRVVPKAVLEEKLYGIDDELGSNAIPVHVHHLRRKLIEGWRNGRDPYGARRRLPPGRPDMSRPRLHSLQLRLVLPLVILFIVGAAVIVGFVA